MQKIRKARHSIAAQAPADQRWEEIEEKSQYVSVFEKIRTEFNV